MKYMLCHTFSGTSYISYMFIIDCKSEIGHKDDKHQTKNDEDKFADANK